MSLSIKQTSPDDPAVVSALTSVISASVEHDLPEFVKHTERGTYLDLKYGWTGRRQEEYVAFWEQRPVARLKLTYPTLDNLNTVHVNIDVVPEFRRRGFGRTLFDKAVERARANERGKLMGNTAWELPGMPAHDGGAGPAFVQAMGLSSANLPEVMRRLDLSTLDSEALKAMRVKADGYRLVRWIDEAPDEYIDDIAYLDGRLLEDAPTGDTGWEPEKVDAKRIRDGEKLSRLRERASYHTGAVHEESNQLVAWTTLARDRPYPGHCWQQITIVEPKHRGHRLGALVKVENLLWYLENEPDTKVIDTWNAAENSYMIAINEQMGFHPLYAFQNWQRDL